MRIISQDGMNDYPYDEIGLSIGWNGEKTEYYVFWNSIHRQMGSKIAVYSSLEKMKKAMEMLRKAYAGLPIIMQNIEITDDVTEMFKEWQKQGIFVQTSDNQPSKVEFLNNGYFQFPADDEVEEQDV